MKANIVIFTLLTVYFLIMSTIYTVINIILHGRPEWAGSVGILFSGALTGFIAYFLVLSKRKQGGQLVEDREDSDVDDGDPEIGEFSPWSWWPFFLAFSLALVILGMCIGNLFWLSIFSLPLVLVGIVGWIYEYYRGNFAR